MNYTKFVAGSLVAAASVSMAADKKKPNIVFIFSDDHSVNAIGAYGSKVNKTPHLDSIANDGAVFNRNYVANSICAPSRACILTGKHSHKNGHKDNSATFDGSQLTFPKLLQKNGYKTGIIGKWHLRSKPTGFDKWMVLPGQGHYYNPDYRTPEGMVTIPGYVTDITTDKSIEWMKEQKDADQPFLMMCQYKAPHRNWMPHPRYMDMYKGETIPEPETLFDDYSNRNSNLLDNEMTIDKEMNLEYDLKVPNHKGKRAGGEWDRMTDDQRDTWVKHYAAEDMEFKNAKLSGKQLVKWKYQRYMKDYLRTIAAVDDNVGRILQFLKDEGLAENTIVVYSSDQSFYLGEHGWFDKRWMYEQSFRQPLLMKWPGVIKPGTAIETMTQNIDFAPTFLEACGIEVPAEIQGKSLIPLMKKGDKASWDRTSLYYHYYERGIHNVARHHGVATNRYKLIQFYDSGEWELMDRLKDPLEMKNFYDDPEYRDVRAAMHLELAKTMADYEAVVPAPVKPKRHNEELNKLIWNKPQFLNPTSKFLESMIVKIKKCDPQFQLRYTTDGSRPCKDSNVYDGPFTITKPTTVKVAMFDGETQISQEVFKTFKRAKIHKPVEAKVEGKGLKFTEYLYDGPEDGEWRKIPNLDKMKPATSKVVKKIGFPKTNDREKFAQRYEGYIKVEKTGMYNFFLNSDDGSRLYINDKLVVDNDGRHGMDDTVVGGMGLEKGLHKFRLDYMEWAYDEALILNWSGPGIKKQQIPAKALKY